MSTTFRQRAETFGFDTSDPWAFDALRLLFNCPRSYEPLVDAWEARHPGTKKALARLVELEFVTHQGPVVIDLRSGKVAEVSSRRLDRWRTTARGSRLAREMRHDRLVFDETFARASGPVRDGVMRLLDALALESSHARFGLSSPHAIAKSGLAERTGRWWIAKLATEGYIRALDEQVADTRSVIPGHWRLTRALCRQLRDVVEAWPIWSRLTRQLRLQRSRFLGDIAVERTRVGISGATDYDHDVEAQRILATFMSSPTFVPGGVFAVEPRLKLPTRTYGAHARFDRNGANVALYSPDAFFTFRDDDGTPTRGVLEYERFQSRRDGWAHLERWGGWLHTMTTAQEPSTLYFVVDSDARLRGYVELIEAFADHSIERPELMPANRCSIAVTSRHRLNEHANPLARRSWFRVDLVRGPAGVATPTLHDTGSSPYESYFAKPTARGSSPSSTR